jgi:hypothetical protein
MIKNPTVFVLGAGSSMPYGFPSGIELIEEIITLYSKNTIRDLFDIYASFTGRIKPATILNFSKSLIDSNAASIDDFLTYHRDNSDYQFVGKIAIFLCIHQHEYPERFAPILTAVAGQAAYKLNQDWYHLLWKDLYQEAGAAKDLQRNNVTFITFNYDRSLEHFLKTSIVGLLKETITSDISEIMQHLPCYHVYGRIGELGYMPDDTKKHEDRKNYANFEMGLTHEMLDITKKDQLIANINQIYKYAEKIWTYTEKEYDTSIFKKTTLALSLAKRIYFLGFQFHPQNMKILFPSDFKPNSKLSIYGTCYKMGERSIEYAKSILLKYCNKDSSRLVLRPVTALEFVQNNGI